MQDEYVEKYLALIKECNNDDGIRDIINEIYEDGFEDGVNEGGE